MDDQDEGIGVVGFLIDERPIVFLNDRAANRRFLEGIDPLYWEYQAAVHAEQLANGDSEQRQRAAAALRLVYGQGLETMFALLAAFVQVPTFPLGWLTLYRNADLRSVVKKIHRGAAVTTALKRRATWSSISAAVHELLPEPTRTELTGCFGAFWERLAGEFIQEQFEPEYNSLKHGMRASVGGFSIAIGLETTFGQPAPPEKMQTVGNTEYGSEFWVPPQKVEGFKLTYELTRNVSRAWVPGQFASALPLIGMSIHNVVSRSLIVAGADPTTTQFVWPSDEQAYTEPWRQRPSISHFSLSQSVDLSGWDEPTPEDIRRIYEEEDDVGPDGT